METGELRRSQLMLTLTSSRRSTTSLSSSESSTGDNMTCHVRLRSVHTQSVATMYDL